MAGSFTDLTKLLEVGDEVIYRNGDTALVVNVVNVIDDPHEPYPIALNDGAIIARNGSCWFGSSVEYVRDVIEVVKCNPETPEDEVETETPEDEVETETPEDEVETETPEVTETQSGEEITKAEEPPYTREYLAHVSFVPMESPAQCLVLSDSDEGWEFWEQFDYIPIEDIHKASRILAGLFESHEYYAQVDEAREAALAKLTDEEKQVLGLGE